MKQSPSEASSRSAGQEIPRFYGTWSFITVFARAATGLYPDQMHPAHN